MLFVLKQVAGRVNLRVTELHPEITMENGTLIY